MAYQKRALAGKSWPELADEISWTILLTVACSGNYDNKDNKGDEQGCTPNKIPNTFLSDYESKRLRSLISNNIDCFDIKGRTMKRSSVYILSTALFLNGCSVYMAASKGGTDFEDLSVCNTRTCLIANGAEPMEVKGMPEDTEAFKVLKAHGSTGRAVMHGLLDVATFGIWEVAGTPIEGAYDKKKYYAIRVTYKPGTQDIKEIALAN